MLAADAASTATTSGLTQPRQPTVCSVACSSSRISRGLSTQTSTPPSTVSISAPNSAHRVSRYVAARTPTTGPTMNVSSVANESSDRAAVRCRSSTEEISTWRTIEKVGTTNRPPTNASGSSSQ